MRHHVTSGNGRRTLIASAATAAAVVAVIALTAGLHPHGRSVLEPAPTHLTGGGLEGAPPDDSSQTGPGTGGGTVGASPVDTFGLPGGVAPPTAPDADGSPVNPPGQAATRPAPAPPRFTAVPGESCPVTATSGFLRKGFARDWYLKARGGWTGDGCQGHVVAVPMSGNTHSDDDDNVIVWWFKPGSATTCALSVYVPGTGDVKDADGAPAQYFVHGGTTGTGPVTGSFTVDQEHNQGRFVAVGSYPVTTGRISVRMVTRGIDFGPGRAGAHLGVSALRASC